MSGACRMYGERSGAYTVLVGKPQRRDHLDDPDVDGRIILKWILRKWNGDMDWTQLAEDRDRWQDVVNVVTNVRFHKMWKIS
jgi:hypothetical protein